MKNIFYYLQCLCVQCLCIATILMGCTNDEDNMITFRDESHNNYYVLIKEDDGEKYALANYDKDRVQTPIQPETDAIFDGTFEFLNVESVKGSQDMVILNSGEEKYLADVNRGLLLDGKPFTHLSKDNLGGVCVHTKDGLIHLTDIKGLPENVEAYCRVTRDNNSYNPSYHYFIYRKNGKYGVMENFLGKYKEFLPCIYDKIVYVASNYALHFIVTQNGNGQIFDEYNKERFVWGSYTNDFYSLIKHLPPTPRDIGITTEYINNMLSLKDNGFINLPYFETTGTFTKYDKNIGVLQLEDGDRTAEIASYWK